MTSSRTLRDSTALLLLLASGMLALFSASVVVAAAAMAAVGRDQYIPWDFVLQAPGSLAIAAWCWVWSRKASPRVHQYLQGLYQDAPEPRA